MKFRWRKGEHENWIKKINRYNRKIDKAKKEGYENTLPEKISYKDSLKKILSSKEYSRREFNNQMKMIDIFLEKDSLTLEKSKKGAIAPKWQLEQISKVILPDINKTNQQYKKMAEKITGIKEKDKLNDNATRKRKLNFDYKSKNDFEMFVQTFNEFNKSIESRTQKTKEGYLKALANEIGGANSEDKMADYNKVGYLALTGILETLPDDVIAANALYNRKVQFDFVYSCDDMKNRFKNIREEWINIAKDYNKEQEKKEKKNKKNKRK